MVIGGFATPMVHGLLQGDWQPVEETTEIVLHCAKLVTFCYQSSYLMVDGERVIYQAKTRQGNLSRFECVLLFYKRKERKKAIVLTNFFVKQVWTNIEGNRENLVQTAWALLSLIDAGQVVPSLSHQLFNQLHIDMSALLQYRNSGFSNSQSRQLVGEVSCKSVILVLVSNTKNYNKNTRNKK